MSNRLDDPIPDYKEEARGVYSLNLLETEVCRSIINQASALKEWTDATIGHEEEDSKVRSIVAPSVRSASVLFVKDVPTIRDVLDRKIAASIKPLVRRIWDLELPDHKGSQIVRYQPGGQYNSHADAGLDYMDRFVTLLCYLNDDFEGGNTSFPYLNNFTVKPRSGMAILFPSLYVHRAEPVLTGEKYIMVTWLTGPVPINWI